MTDQKNSHEPPVQPARPWPRWLRLLVVLCISLAAHASLLWLASGHFAKKPDKPRTQNINLVIRERPSVATPRIEVPPPKPVTTQSQESAPEVVTRPETTKPHDRGPAGILDFPDLAPAREPTIGKTARQDGGDSGTASDDNTSNGKKPGDVDLFKGEAVSSTAHTFSTPQDTDTGNNLPQRGELSANERAEDALARMQVDQAAEQHVQKLEPTPELVMTQAETDRTWNPPSPAVAGSRKKCKTAGPHSVGCLSAIVDVSKSDSDGQMTVIVAGPSGDPDFDKSAVDAVKAALPGTPKTYVWSRWRFNAEVYRWSAKDMLLDPSFKPPGRKLPSSGLGAMSMTTSVRLLAFR